VRRGAREAAVKRVLIIEDNELNSDALSRRLMRRGYDVLLAADGAEGLNMARAETPDLILMDLGLPGIDGWECTRRLKAEPATRTIPIVALSAHAMVGEREKALRAGCDDFSTKPIDFAALLETMARLLTLEGPGTYRDGAGTRRMKGQA
jgi:CheY-like chemotaxis protein